MENQPPRLPWFRLATMVRQQDNDSPLQPALPLARQSITPPQRITTPLAPPPTSSPRVNPPLVLQPTPQPAVRPASPAVQQEVPKQVVETSNGSIRPTRTPPPSPKVIKSALNPSPLPSPKVVTPPLLPPIFTGGNNNLTSNPEPEMSKINRHQSIAMQDVEDKKDNGGNYNDNHINNNYNDNHINHNSNSKKNNGGNYNDNHINNNYNDNHINHNSNGKNSDGKNHSNNSSNSVNMRGNLQSYERKENPRTNELRVNHSPLNHRKNEKDTKVVTIAGENVGAFMELGHPKGHNRKMHHETGNNLMAESKKQDDQKRNERNKNMGAKPITSLVNSNVQSINNSLMFNSSCSERSPGVHLTFKRKGVKSKTGSSSP